MPESDDPQLMGTFREDDTGAEVLVDVEAPDADVVVLQRPLRWEVADAVPMLQGHGLRVVIEVDDDFAAIHPHNVSFDHVHPKRSPDRNFHHLQRACAQADHVVVTTPALARRYGKHGRVTVVPNHVPKRYLDVTVEPNEATYVGWTGSIDTHPTDLQVTGSGIQSALTATGAKFAVVGTGKGVRKALSLIDEPVTTGWVAIEDYPACMAQLDVGIVPLDDIVFNQGKSNLKALEFAALGVPAVVSPTQDNERLAKLGAGVLAGNRREWAREVARLAGDPSLRVETGGRAREVAARWTIEGNCERWWEAWTAPLRERKAA